MVFYDLAPSFGIVYYSGAVETHKCVRDPERLWFLTHYITGTCGASLGTHFQRNFWNSWFWEVSVAKWNSRQNWSSKPSKNSVNLPAQKNSKFKTKTSIWAAFTEILWATGRVGANREPTDFLTKKWPDIVQAFENFHNIFFPFSF